MDGRTDGSSFHVAQPRLISGESLFLSDDRKEEIHPSLCVCVRGACPNVSLHPETTTSHLTGRHLLSRSIDLLLFDDYSSCAGWLLKNVFRNGNLFHCIETCSPFREKGSSVCSFSREENFFSFLSRKFLFGVEILVEFFLFPVSSFDSLSGRKKLFSFLILDLVLFFFFFGCLLNLRK